MPKVFANGSTADDCIQATREAMCGVAAMLLEEGKSPPLPHAKGLGNSKSTCD